MSSLIANMLTALCGMGAYIYIIVKRGDTCKKSLIMSVILLFFMTICIFFNENCSGFDLFWIWCYLGIAMLMLEYSLSYNLVLMIYYCFIVYIVINILKGNASNSIIYTGSENNISVYLLLMLSLYFILKEENGSFAIKDFVHVVFGLLVSFWSASRAGALCFGIMLIFMILYYMKISGKKIRLIVLMAVALICAYFLLDRYAFILGNIQSKISKYGNTSLRTVIWKEYLSSATSSIQSFFFGPNTKDSTYYWLSFYGGNTHNSFLTLHANYGLAIFAIVIILLIKSIFVFLSNKKILSSLCLVLLILRSCFDWTSFPGIYDSIYYFAILVVLSQDWYFFDKKLWRVLDV